MALSRFCTRRVRWTASLSWRRNTTTKFAIIIVINCITLTNNNIPPDQEEDLVLGVSGADSHRSSCRRGRLHVRGHSSNCFRWQLCKTSFRPFEKMKLCTVVLMAKILATILALLGHLIIKLCSATWYWWRWFLPPTWPLESSTSSTFTSAWSCARDTGTGPDQFMMKGFHDIQDAEQDHGAYHPAL